MFCLLWLSSATLCVSITDIVHELRTWYWLNFFLARNQSRQSRAGGMGPSYRFRIVLPTSATSDIITRITTRVYQWARIYRAGRTCGLTSTKKNECHADCLDSLVSWMSELQILYIGDLKNKQTKKIIPQWVEGVAITGIPGSTPQLNPGTILSFVCTQHFP